MAFKCIAERYFSLSAFAVIQVLMDVEPVIRALRGDSNLHGFTHTYLGASLIAILAFPASLFLCPHILRMWNWVVARYRIGVLTVEKSLKMGPIAVGVSVGALSHVAIDSIMHAEMRPLAPFSNRNALLNFISMDALDLSCFFLGLIGIIVYVFVKIHRNASAVQNKTAV